MQPQIGPRPYIGPQLPTHEKQQVDNKQVDNKIEFSKPSSLEKAVHAIHVAGVRLTRLLPFSSRGVVINIIRTPFRLLQSLVLGFADMVKQKSIKAFGTTLVKEMSNYMKKDWVSGIEDFYTDLRSSSNKEIGKKIAKENLSYASYMYNQYLRPQQKNDAYETIACAGIPIPKDIDQAPTDVKSRLEAIDKELTAQGFEKDIDGNYFHQVTGTMFNLVYESAKNEFIVCFWGLGNENNLNLIKTEEPDFSKINFRTAKTEEKEAIIAQDKAHREEAVKSQQVIKKVGKENTTAAVLDFVGGIQPSALQAIEIAKILKEATKGSNITPVIVGHSHGGGLAQCAAASNGLKGVLFNPRPMGAGMRRLIGQNKIAENSKNIIAFSGEGDFLTSNRLINILAIGFERLTGIPVPRTIGQGFKLPKAPHPTAEEQAAHKKLWVDAGYPEGPPRPLQANQHCDFEKQLRELVKK